MWPLGRLPVATVCILFLRLAAGVLYTHTDVGWTMPQEQRAISYPSMVMQPVPMQQSPQYPVNSCCSNSLFGIHQLFGYIRSPYFPTLYNCPALNCNYTVAERPGWSVHVSIEYMDTEDNYDFVTISSQAEGTGQSTQLAKYHGCVLTISTRCRNPQALTLAWNVSGSVTVNFKTDGSGARKGFQILFVRFPSPAIGRRLSYVHS